MAQPSHKTVVYLEIGKKRTFAGAIDWPGWCRSGRDEESALQALFEYGPRYAEILRSAHLGFHAPTDIASLTVGERLEGTTTTDFGAPGEAPSADKEPVDDKELGRYQTLLQACWDAFDAALATANGQELRPGPRGGGRDADKIIEHIVGAEGGYLSAVGGKVKIPDGADGRTALEHTRQAILSALAASAHGEIAARGPRGGVRWTPRYFVRRVAWHVLDHTWEIEDRLT
jgi:hypothetical protein